MERLTYFKDGYWRVNFSGVQYQADFVDRLAAIRAQFGAWEKKLGV